MIDIAALLLVLLFTICRATLLQGASPSNTPASTSWRNAVNISHPSPLPAFRLLSRVGSSIQPLHHIVIKQHSPLSCNCRLPTGCSPLLFASITTDNPTNSPFAPPSAGNPLTRQISPSAESRCSCRPLLPDAMKPTAEARERAKSAYVNDLRASF